MGLLNTSASFNAPAGAGQALQTEKQEQIDPANPWDQLKTEPATPDTITQISSYLGVSLEGGVPQLIKDATYTLTLAEANYHLYKTNTSAYTWTIPANSSVAFKIGTCITFVNGGSSGNITIGITTDTMRLAGTTSTGNRTLAAYSMATALKVTATTWIINGTGIT